MYGFGDACFCRIAAHFEGILCILIRCPTPRFQLEAGFSATRIFDAFMTLDTYIHLTHRNMTVGTCLRHV